MKNQKHWKDLQDESLLHLKKDFKGLTKNQDLYIKAIESSTITICAGPAGSGKAQPLYSRILTPNGWICMGDAKVGIVVCTPNGKTASINGVFPQGIKDVYEIEFSDGSKTRCSDEHLWKIFNPNLGESGKWTVVDLQTIMKYQGRLKERIGTPLTEPVFFNKKNLPLDPYLLGVLIGDGCLRIGTRFSSADQELVDKISKIVKSYDCHVVKLKNKYDYSITRNNQTNNQITVVIKELGLWNKLSYEKTIPFEYMSSSYDDRLALIRGLMDTDGTVSKKRGVTFCTTSEKLALQMQELIRSVGGLCKISTRTTYFTYKGIKKYGRTAYILSIRHNHPTELFSLTRKIERLNYNRNWAPELRKRIINISYIGKEECQCISIDDNEHLYITDDYVVTHNTFCACGLAAKYLREGKINKIIITRPLVTCGKGIGFLPGELEEKVNPYMRPIFDAFENFFSPVELDRLVKEGKIEVVPLELMRGSSIRNTLILLDEAQNATYVQLYMLMTRFGDGTKVIITGDENQSDLDGHDNFFAQIVERFSKRRHKDISVIVLERKDIVRHPLIIFVDEVMLDHKQDETVESGTWRDLSCPDCHKVNWYNNGDEYDLNTSDVECVECWQCRKLFTVDEEPVLIKIKGNKVFEYGHRRPE